MSLAITENEPDQIIPDCYHATNKRFYEKILSDGFNRSRGTDHWLGDGVYFWESTITTARWWGKKYHSPWIIFKARLKIGHCLNLANDEHRRLLEKSKNLLEQRGVTNPTDAIVINFLCMKIRAFDSIRCSFLRPNWPSLYAGSRIPAYNQIICVRNIDNIVLYGLCEEEDSNDKRR